MFYIAGDNGTSGEGGQNGMFNEYTYFNGVQEKVEDMLKLMDKWGGPETYPHMAAGWAIAFNAPFGWMKQVPSDFGGTRNGMAVSWPKGITAKNGIRTQFGHVIDVAPTVLEAIGLPEPASVNGVQQIPMAGTSLLYSFDDAGAKERHTTQYFEIAGNRAIYHDGWYARTIHRAPWEAKPRRSLKDNSAWAALRRAIGLQPFQRCRGAEPGEARRAAGAVPRGGHQDMASCPWMTACSSGWTPHPSDGPS